MSILLFHLYIDLHVNITLILQTTEAVQTLLTTAEPVDAVVSAPLISPNADPTPPVIQPITEQVTEAPVTALDVLHGVGTEASLSELGLGGYTPVGLIQNLLEFMHVSIGLPWWGAIVAGKKLYCNMLAFYYFKQ